MDRRQHRVLEGAVARAEQRTGLQFCVFLGAIDDERPREHAESLFTRAGLHEQPAILVVVAPKQRRVEIVTSADVRGRVSDGDAAATLATMTSAFERGDLIGGLVEGLDGLAAVAGSGQRGDQTDLPDIIDEGT